MNFEYRILFHLCLYIYKININGYPPSLCKYLKINAIEIKGYDLRNLNNDQITLVVPVIKTRFVFKHFSVFFFVN